jgi:hypothetical protein
LQIGIDHLPSFLVGGRQMRQFVHTDRLAVPPHADPRQPLFQIARMPLSGTVVGTFEQMPKLQADRFQDFLVLGVHSA